MTESAPEPDPHWMRTLGLADAVVPLPGLLHADDLAALLAAAAGRPAQVIANAHQPSDRSRRMVSFADLPPDGGALQLVQQRLRARAELAGRADGMRVYAGHMLESDPSGPAQPLHTDVLAGEAAAVRRRAGGRPPASVLVTLDADGALLLLNRADPREVFELPLPRPGDAVWFDGDVVHGGCSYPAPHRRCHFHLLPEGVPSAGASGEVLDVVRKPITGFARVQPEELYRRWWCR